MGELFAGGGVKTGDGLSMAFGLFKNVSRTNYFKTRLPVSSAWAILAGLFVASWQMVFKESYPINARLFFSLWTLYTVFSVIIFDVLDILTAFVPAQYIPFCMFTWMITTGSFSLQDRKSVV